MTKKVISFWKSMSFWTKVQGFSALFGIGSELTLFMMESHPGWKTAAAVATIVGLALKYFIEDKDNNGEVDLFQDTTKDE